MIFSRLLHEHPSLMVVAEHGISSMMKDMSSRPQHRLGEDTEYDDIDMVR